jgi:hypothetical protein
LSNHAFAGGISESDYFPARVIFVSNCGRTKDRYLQMALNSHELFANLAERERVYGHHSAEGQAIRTLARALDGWSTATLGATDVVGLCAQAVEDWLKRRLNRSPWSAQGLAELLRAAQAAAFLSACEAGRLQRLAELRAQLPSGAPAQADIEDIMAAVIDIVERHWS